MHVVIDSLEQTFSQVQITNWVDGFGEVNRSWELTVSVAPVMLDSFQMPLIDYCDDDISFALIDGLEEILISLVNEDILEFGEEDVH